MNDLSAVIAGRSSLQTRWAKKLEKPNRSRERKSRESKKDSQCNNENSNKNAADVMANIVNMKK